VFVGDAIWAVVLETRYSLVKWFPLVAALAVVVVAGLWLKWWIDGRRGLNQWPDPYGHFYNRWLRLPRGHGDYYDWLAKQMGDREPWRTWATLYRSCAGADESDDDDD
jgi:hypothetical protein